MNDHLGIRIAIETMARCDKFRTDFQVVVDFAVEGDPDGSILIRHGLVTGLGQIDDGKASMAQTDIEPGDQRPIAAQIIKSPELNSVLPSLIRPRTCQQGAFVIRSSMGQTIPHPDQPLRLNRPTAISENPADAAHYSQFPFRPFIMVLP
jgi:hypothetical protein